jgi:hypothetical protein
LAQLKSSHQYETGEYKIIFPGPPVRTTHKPANEPGLMQFTVVAYQAGDSLEDGNQVFAILETTFSTIKFTSDDTASVNIFFKSAINAAVNDFGNTLLTEVNGKVGNYPSRTIEIKYANGLAIMRMKMIFFESKLITIETITEISKYPNPSIDKFFDSFILVN